jgi:hypothetical protein
MLQWHSSNSSNQKLLTKHYPLFRINSFWKVYLFKSIMCLFHIMCLNNKLSGIDSIEPHLGTLYHRPGIHLFSTSAPILSRTRQSLSHQPSPPRSCKWNVTMHLYFGPRAIFSGLSLKKVYYIDCCGLSVMDALWN